MNLEAFRALVEENRQWFAGVHPEPVETLDAAEQALRCELPQSLRWMLGTLGYSAACGIDSLDEVVAATLRCRAAFGMPYRYVVLNDWGDAGVVVMEVARGLDPERWPIFWMAVHNLYRVAGGQLIDTDCDRFDGFVEWVRGRLRVAMEDVS